ncbi:MAG TPA: hypothetical protein VGR67_09205 [Candidatus Polarisedimenticolia bacterium]|jgi:hypothetical protein|nr:hypothetical protein [Candidatus Polarisedimenticolia bacterium]
MKHRALLVPAALVLVLLATPLFAAAPEQTGKENAAARIAEATAAQTQILTDLLSKLPAQSLPAVQDAILASQHGRETALAAIAKSDNDGAESASQKAGNGKAQLEDAPPSPTTGLTHARETLAASFEKSVATLQDLLGKVPEQAMTHVESAITKMQAQRALALQKLDGLIAGAKPGHETINRPDHPDRPQKPERPEKAERPEVPDRPQLPERAEKPDHPTGKP